MDPDDHEPIDVEELRRHTSRYVEVARSGRRVPITENGRVVAYLVSPSRAASPGAGAQPGQHDDQ